MALTLQSFLAMDPESGDLDMQEYLHPVMASAAIVQSYYSTKDVPQNVTAAFPGVRFLSKYKDETLSFADIHLREWNVSTALCTLLFIS
jgi:hypothetical protein